MGIYYMTTLDTPFIYLGLGALHVSQAGASHPSLPSRSNLLQVIIIIIMQLQRHWPGITASSDIKSFKYLYSTIFYCFD